MSAHDLDFLLCFSGVAISLENELLNRFHHHFHFAVDRDDIDYLASQLENQYVYGNEPHVDVVLAQALYVADHKFGLDTYHYGVPLSLRRIAMDLRDLDQMTPTGIKYLQSFSQAAAEQFSRNYYGNLQHATF